jgi:hypothetical protein
VIASSPRNIDAFRKLLKAGLPDENAVTSVTPVTSIKSTGFRLQTFVTSVTEEPTEEEERQAQLIEREAFSAFEGGIHPTFVSAFANLQMAQPPSVPEVDWHRAINDAGLFLDAFGAKAAAFGWQPEGLFEDFGLIWALNGATVTDITTNTAMLSDGRTFTVR